MKQLSKEQARTSLGSMIRQCYTQRGLTREGAATSTRISPDDLRKIEVGDLDCVSRGTIEKTINAFFQDQKRRDAYQLLLAAKPPASRLPPKLDPKGHIVRV